ncbi:MAG: hypothetical protein IPP90_07180 [Gemmatimonadaceae bacterium]|nr:hypothetical protein [Gemmatimonadaceae bacterium]
MKRDLWLRVRQYHFADIVPTQLWGRVAEAFGGTDASTKAFASKIARKHVWSTHFALRAIDEYRKFVFLGVTGDGIVTPSKVIDTVWHEHLLFTRAYREFCRDVLQRDFDHHPELMPSEEQTGVYAQQFEATLARYRAEFNVRPPWDIWGTPKFKRDDATAQADSGAAVGSGDVPLYQQFDGHGDTPGHFDMPEFNADSSGGGFSGGGGGSDWGDAHGTDSDSGSGDSGSDGGSGCSSGCGGGGD